MAEVASPAGAALTGALLGVSLAAPPGPVMAVMATEAVRGRSREAILIALGSILAFPDWDCIYRAMGLTAVGPGVICLIQMWRQASPLIDLFTRTLCGECGTAFA